MEAVVEAEGLEKVYGETVALSGASLSVERGEIFALIGPNGAGKTTLVRALTGTTEPDSGTARVLEESPDAVDRNRLGVLPQAFSPPARLAARELLTYYAGLYDDARDPDEVLADVGLADAGGTWYEDLSGGQQRRVCVGATLVNDPEVLFLDEPTTGIDPAGRRTVWRLIEELASAGTTVVLTTHDMAEAERLADRVGLLADGALVARGTPDALVREHGGSSRLRIETDADTGAFRGLEYPTERPARNRQRSDRSETDGTVVVRNVEPTEIAAVVDYLEDRDLAYSGLSWSEPGLEEVYLELADETERDRTVAPTNRSEGSDGGRGSDDDSRTDDELPPAGETA
ncbi:ABC transporter ATP-binding protein [Natrarchaeobius chitinivorans]|uniref:ABC transporter ATP-binding protein n=1 Tax=Natrarchaeobius chitinivorans TaxID=1679083 RepID=A0A3N6NEI7_NATCH|nr:ABC transporter ATP-binding protein [Natrarchaeobius chitinivorans]RQG97292.1 ABC transporter ATP-binding protein [Natrarchaeobius chitinivorans]